MTRRIFAPAAAAGLALIAAACAEMPSSTYAPAPDQAARPSARSAPPTPTPVPADASVLVGRDARELAKLFGPPQLKRLDPPAELWQYRTGSCVLDLFLYADKAGNAATVAHVETRAVNAESNRAECLRAFISGGG